MLEPLDRLSSWVRGRTMLCWWQYYPYSACVFTQSVDWLGQIRKALDWSLVWFLLDLVDDVPSFNWLVSRSCSPFPPPSSSELMLQRAYQIGWMFPCFFTFCPLRCVSVALEAFQFAGVSFRLVCAKYGLPTFLLFPVILYAFCSQCCGDLVWMWPQYFTYASILLVIVLPSRACCSLKPSCGLLTFLWHSLQMPLGIFDLLWWWHRMTCLTRLLYICFSVPLIVYPSLQRVAVFRDVL